MADRLPPQSGGFGGVYKPSTLREGKGKRPARRRQIWRARDVDNLGPSGRTGPISLRPFQPELPHQRAPLVDLGLDVALSPLDRRRRVRNQPEIGDPRFISGGAMMRFISPWSLSTISLRRGVPGRSAHAMKPPRSRRCRTLRRIGGTSGSVPKPGRRGDRERAQLAVPDQRKRCAGLGERAARDRRRRRRSPAGCCGTAHAPSRSRTAA